MRYTAILSILAISSVLAVAQSEPRTAEEFYALAQKDLAQKQLERVIEDCTQALAFDPDFQEALLMRAATYSTLRQREKAIADLDSVLKMHPRSSTFVFRGNQHMLLNHYAAALADFTEAIERMPNGPAVYELRANARQKLGDSSGAAEDRAKAASLVNPPLAGYAPAVQPGASTLVAQRVTQGMTPPKVLSKNDPSYTEEARTAKIQGNVILSLIVDSQGVARSFQIVRPLGYGLDEKAIEAVQHWKFQPGMKDGSAVATYATIEVTFRLL